MTGPIAMTISFLLVAVVQTSFFASLPGPLAFVPLVLATGIYLRQHAQRPSGALWILGFGIFQDVLSGPSFPLETLSYGVAALTAMVTARNVFSNRSWYGLLACGGTSVLALCVTRAAILVLVSLRHPENVSWSSFLDTSFWNFCFLLLALALYVALAKPLRAFLGTTFMIAKGHDAL